MISHRPSGSGHPYRDDTGQRSPVVPVAGEPVRLGVRTSAGMTDVRLEFVAGDRLELLALEPVVVVDRGRASEGGHLARAQASADAAARGWSVTLPSVAAGVEYRYRFTSADASGRLQHTRWFEFRASEWRGAPDAVRSAGRSRIIDGTVSVLTDGERVSRVRFALPLSATEHITGLGERFDALDHRGALVDSVVFEQYKNQAAERKTYLPMPFAHVVGGDGWGFHVRTPRRVWFDFGKSESDRIWVEAEADAPLGELAAEIAFYDGSPRDVLDVFLAETGRAEELPSWVFRLWASGNEWNTQAEILRQVELHRQHDIPVGSVVIEAWSDEGTFTAWRDARYAVNEDAAPHRLGDFEFPADGAWPDPKGMIDELHDRDIRVLLWQIPLMKMRPHPTGQAAADADVARRENLLIRELAPDGRLRPYRNRGFWFPQALMPDLTDQRAALWWTEKRRYLVEQLGVDGFKTDGGEHAWGSDLRYLDGEHGDAKNNTFPVAYAKVYGDLLRSAGKAPVTFSRAGFTGSQAHGVFWAGDENSTWDAFRASMLAGLSAASSGIVYWGWDIAGFSGELPSSELYLRATAASTFLPIMQYHSEFNFHRLPSRDRTPWNVAEQSGDDRVIPVFRRFAQLRERLLPYLVAETRKTIATSSPLMRPLYFDFPNDEKVWQHPVQWMLGDSMLIAPVIEPGADSWQVYLPDGEWIDAFTGEGVSAGTVSRQAPIDQIPAYVRADDWSRLSVIF